MERAPTHLAPVPDEAAAEGPGTAPPAPSPSTSAAKLSMHSMSTLVCFVMYKVCINCAPQHAAQISHASAFLDSICEECEQPRPICPCVACILNIRQVQIQGMSCANLPRDIPINRIDVGGVRVRAVWQSHPKRACALWHRILVLHILRRQLDPVVEEMLLNRVEVLLECVSLCL